MATWGSGLRTRPAPKPKPIKPPHMAQLKSPGTPPRLRRPPVFAKGPKLYTQPVILEVGFGPPPQGFVTATTSASEWKVYAALAAIFHDPVDPRQPPFFGARDGSWAYQANVQGGRHLPGGSVPDYVVYTPTSTIFLRLQTWRYHIATSGSKQAYDRMQLFTLSNQGLVIDLYEDDFINDPTDQTVVKLVKAALSGQVESDPIYAGTAYQVRPGSAAGAAGRKVAA